MSNNSIERVKVIPDWFDLNNYQTARNMDARQWADQLEFRLTVREHKEHTKECEFRDYAQNLFEDIKSIGIIPREKIIACPTCVERYYEDKTPDNIKTVRSTRYIDILTSIHSDIERYLLSDKSIARAFNYYLTSDTEYSELDELNKPIDPILEKLDIDIPDEIPVYVNTLATDEQIINDLKIWLTNYRKLQADSSGHNKLFSEKLFRKWANNQMLPFIDLTLWEYFSNTKITEAALIYALFPGQSKSDGAIRKTLKSHCKKYYNTRTVEALRLLASNEKPKPYPKAGIK